jgi:ribonuclease HI
MKLIVYFDASFSPKTKKAGLAFIIKDANEKTLLKSSKKISCKNSFDAELRALNKAIGYIIDRQSKYYLPQGCTIIIYGDNQGVIDLSNKMTFAKKIHKGFMGGFLKNVQTLRETNNVVFKWISRNHNKEADKESRIIFY